MRAPALPATLLLAFVLVCAPPPAAGQKPRPAGGAAPAAGRFPHARHEGLFPQCTVCHRGVETGDADERYPAPAACRNCHDGSTRQPVNWTGPTVRVSNLSFSHPRHDAAVSSAGESTACLDCHRTPGESGRMAVSPPQPQYCTGCHAHHASAHMAPEARCTTCHLPLASTRLSEAAVAALPKPPDHEAADWVLQHAPASPAVAAARCAICHARESCERCHMNAASIPAIQALARDRRVAALLRDRAPSYPRPPSHGSGSWDWKHGAAAAGGAAGREASASTAAGCSDCHARASCRACHRDGSTPAIEALPEPGGRRPAGVSVAPRPVHAAGFLKDHPTQAAAGVACAACHTRSFCVDCHQGQKAGYHAPNFVEQHGPEAYANDTQCSECHSNEAFCRTCHLRTGQGARTRNGAAFHGEQPLWLLSHGQAARQGLEACTACHTQTSCAECHSAAGGWGVNPHPANFDARRARERNPSSCLHCHAELPND